MSGAIRAANWDAVQYFLLKKASVHSLNILSSYGAPLHHACRMGNLDIIKLLVQKGAEGADAKTACRNMVGTPIMQACIRFGDNFATEKEAIVRHLLENSHTLGTGKPNTWCPIHVASLTCSADIIKLFHQNGVDAGMQDHMGRKAVHLACYNSLGAQGFPTKTLVPRTRLAGYLSIMPC